MLSGALLCFLFVCSIVHFVNDQEDSQIQRFHTVYFISTQSLGTVMYTLMRHRQDKAQGSF